MVYVFFVQPGDMMTFDNQISIMQSVSDLKEKIHEICGISLEQQVLLINGGEPLDSTKNLCSYMAGTDTNPIYLFSTNYDLSKIKILENLNFDDSDLKTSLLESYNLPVSLATVKTRAQVAQEFFNVAKRQLEFCENMVHDQHMQQQGWSAVIANLEDIVSEFRKRWELFLKMYNDFMADRDTYDDFLQHFHEDKKMLQRIPVIDTLLGTEKELMNNSKLSETTTSTSQETETSKEISLYEWISSSDSKNSLDELYELCKGNLKKFEKEVMPSLEKQITETLHSAEKPERKEIEGLGKRLFDLEELLRKIKKYVEHQSDMAQSFLQNQNRANHIQDISILPDLCATHLQQLEYIKQCHTKLMDDRNRIVRAKFELCKSLCARIGWVQNVEDKLWELDSLLVYFHEHLQRLRKHLEVFQQLHLAPVTYMNAVVEVVRRRAFSQLFLLWASDLACHQLTIHNEELTRRKEFASQFEGHFLNALFPGMGDVPPAFAIEAPSMFDAKLPKITEEDVEKLKKEVPDFSESLTLPDMNAIANFFMGKSGSAKDKHKIDDSTAVEEKLIQAVSDVGLASNSDKNLLKATGSESCLITAHGLPNLKDLDKGCESETDTEEFEKVGQSPLELHFPQGATNATPEAPKVAEKQDASTWTEVRTERAPIPPKKPPRSFHRAPPSLDDQSQRTASISTNDSFANIKNMSLDSIDELSSIKNFTSGSESCFNSHHNQTNTLNVNLSESSCCSKNSSGLLLCRSKSVSPQSPRDASPLMGHQQVQMDFVNDEFYIDESLPSSVEAGNSQGSEFVRQLDTANVVVAMLQENLQISRTEHDQVKSLLVNLGTLAKEATMELRKELNELKVQFLSNSSTLCHQYEDLGGSWETLILEIDHHERTLVESMKKEHKNEIELYKGREVERDEAIKKLEHDKSVMQGIIEGTCRDLKALEEKLAQSNEDSVERIEDLLKQLHDKDVEKEKSIKELSEMLKLEHKAEIDSIKSRFKLMTMERSPSCNSLEKEKTGDFASLPGHTTLLVQMTENFEMDKEKAVKEEKERWEKVLEVKIKELEARFREEKEIFAHDAAKRAIEDKDKQIDVLRERERNLNLECIKHKTTIQQLAECEVESRDAELLEQVDAMKRERDALREELERVRGERLGEMAASVAVCEGKVDTATSPAHHPSHSDLSKSEMLAPHPRRLNIDTCKYGDLVLVLWDAVHENFKILQESKHMYFLHTDCLERLGLSMTDATPNKFHCIGEVGDKEYCHARKSENRYKVPKGTKFFRVKVKPPSRDQSQSLYQPRPSVSHAPLMTQSQSSVSTFDPLMEESQSPTRLAVTLEEGRGDDVDGRGEEQEGREFSDTGRIDFLDQPEEVRPESVEKNFAEDSGIVENVEQATAASEENVLREKSVEDDRTAFLLTPVPEPSGDKS